MTKTGKDFETTLNFGTTLEMKQQMTAMGYFLTGKKEYSSAARNMIQRGFRAWLAGLSDKEKREFDEILERVKIMVVE